MVFLIYVFLLQDRVNKAELHIKISHQHSSASGEHAFSLLGICVLVIRLFIYLIVCLFVFSFF